MTRIEEVGGVAYEKSEEQRKQRRKRKSVGERKTTRRDDPW